MPGGGAHLPALQPDPTLGVAHAPTPRAPCAERALLAHPSALGYPPLRVWPPPSPPPATPLQVWPRRSRPQHSGPDSRARASPARPRPAGLEHLRRRRPAKRPRRRRGRIPLRPRHEQHPRKKLAAAVPSFLIPCPHPPGTAGGCRARRRRRPSRARRRRGSRQSVSRYSTGRRRSQ